MKKRLNIIFFSVCFLGAILAEAYFLQAGEGKLFSVIAIGGVVLITGYLLMDSVRSKLTESKREVKNYLDQMYREDSERFRENMEELKNLQKATYTATKKNTAMLSQQLDTLLDRVEALENNQAISLNKLIELQRKALEGQKNALNLEINYNKENTKHMIKALKEAGNQEETKELLNKLLERLERGTQVLQNELQNISISIQGPVTNNLYTKNEWETEQQAEITQITTATSDWDGDVDLELNNLIQSWEMEPNTEITPEIIAVEEDEQESEVMEQSMIETTESEETVMDEEAVELQVEEAAEPQADEAVEPQVEEAVELQADDMEAEETIVTEIKPLYDDPNKALSADEIAALFASFGQ